MKEKIGIPILQKVKDKFQIEEKNINRKGKLVFENQIELRNFTQKINEGKDLIYNSIKAATAGELNAVLIITSLMRKIITKYTDEKNPEIMRKAYQFLIDKIGKYDLDKLAMDYHKEFVTYSETDFLNETLLIWLINQNSAFDKYQVLFNDETLKAESNYPVHFEQLKKFFKTQNSVDNKNIDLVSFLLEPILKFPNSIFDQLNFIKEYWKELIDDELFLLL
ncbi:MAG: hypothetical protein HQ554_02390, partial [FCB group bacterium]|nr:hypothetical protein [FCB group bacterium]